MTFYYIDWVATICSLMAAYLIGNQERKGFLLFIFANFAWIAVGGLSQSIAIITGNLAFFLLNLRAYQQWGKTFRTDRKLVSKT